MDIRELRTFIAVAQTGNITRAAEELHISQPALSRQIIKLENELGCKLLERGGHGISLTNAGHLLLNRARELSDLLDKTETELKTPDVASGEVSIACSETHATLAIARIAKRLSRTHPNIRFKFRSESSDDVTEHLSRGIVDFGIAVDPARTDDYHALKLPDTNRWGALVPADDDLAFIPLAPSLTSHVELIWSRSHRLSPAGQAFLDAAAAYLDEDREQALQRPRHTRPLLRMGAARERSRAGTVGRKKGAGVWALV